MAGKRFESGKQSQRRRGTERYDSELYGEAVYEQAGSTKDPIPGGDLTGGGGQSPVLRNWQTGERLFLRRLELKDRWIKSAYFRRVVEPPRTDRVLWPVDLLALPDSLIASCTLFVDHEYTARPTPPRARTERYAVALPFPKDRCITGGIAEIARLQRQGWKNPRAREIVVQLARALADLNREGYLYQDFYPSRLCFGDGGRLFLDYSNLACPYQEKPDGADALLCRPGERNYPVEFADPSVIRGQVHELNFRSQNFSLCAMLFYLLMGRYAYDGSLLNGYPDNDPDNHYIKFRDYHKMPVFIFDPENRSNAIGTFEEERKTVALWEEAPEELRGWFLHALCRPPSSANPAESPSPENWLALFRHLGWTRE